MEAEIIVYIIFMMIIFVNCVIAISLLNKKNK